MNSPSRPRGVPIGCEHQGRFALCAIKIHIIYAWQLFLVRNADRTNPRSRMSRLGVVNTRERNWPATSAPIESRETALLCAALELGREAPVVD